MEMAGTGDVGKWLGAMIIVDLLLYISVDVATCVFKEGEGDEEGG